MKLREIIKLSSIMLGLDDILTMEELYNASFDITDEDSYLQDKEETNAVNVRNLILLVRCFNLAYSEIATDYVPLKFKETIEVTSGYINLDDLKKKFYKLINIENIKNKKTEYEMYSNKIYLENGTYVVTYNYIPEFATLNTELETFDGKILDRVFAYGLNKEYCYISGLYSEAESWKNKFEDSLKLVLLKQNFTLKKRRWF